jgi:hypothetical protein
MYDDDSEIATREAHVRARMGEGRLSPERDRMRLHERTDGVNQRLDQLDKMVAALHDRLEPVLTPARPRPAVAVGPDRTDDGSWLADYLDATARRLEASVDSVRELLERVEL